jgi:hypothetical protein
LLVESKNTNLIGVIFNRFRCDNNPVIRVGRDSHSGIHAVSNQPGVVAVSQGYGVLPTGAWLNVVPVKPDIYSVAFQVMAETVNLFFRT